MKKKKKLSILFIIFREEKLGYKDIDHILPFLYFLNKSNDINLNAKLLIFSDEITYKKNIDPRIKFLFNLKNVELIFLYNNKLFCSLKNLLTLKNNSKLAFLFNKIINKFYFIFFKLKKENIILKNKELIDFIKNKNFLIATTTINRKEILEFIKKINNKSKWMVIPHGTTLLDNSMVMDTDLNKYAKKNSGASVKKIDYILTTSEQDLQNIIANMTDKNKFHVIGSPRYCKDWLKIKSKFKIDGNDVSLNKKYKVKILFLIPKNFINIFTDELIRTIDFISSYQEIELILLKNNFSYPKIPSFIAKRSNIRHYYVSVEYSTSKLIEWADIVFHAGTGVIFESFMKEKVTVLPRYLTCNTLISDKYNAGLNLRNRDELRNLCNAAVISLENLKKEYKKKSNSSNKKFINQCVNGNLNSVPKMIQKSLLSIVSKF